MPNNKRKSRHSLAQQKLNVASIVQRLPFHQQLSASHALLLKIAPIWHAWCQQQYGQRGSQISLATHSELTSIDHGELCIDCHNSSVATILKHQQTSLLNALHNAGFSQISRIRFRIKAFDLPPLESQYHQEQGLVANDQPHPVDRSPLTTSSIKSIEAVQRRVKNESLSQSLKRLIATLKK